MNKEKQGRTWCTGEAQLAGGSSQVVVTIHESYKVPHRYRGAQFSGTLR